MEVKEIPEFVDRKKELREFKALLSGRPNLVYFVYGPINSGKTALLMKVFEELPEDYRVFYINFRWKYVASVEDLFEVLFEVKEGEFREGLREVIKELLKSAAGGIKKFYGIPISERVFDLLFRKGKIKNIFSYLENVFEVVKEEGKQPVFILDEMQSIKGVINTAGKPVIEELFNFFVGMTKERHLCHCLCATSDCLFIEGVYSNARLEGRARYILVDDLSKKEAFSVYKEFGFEDKEFVWEYIGGKIGDMVRLYEDKKRGLSEEEALREMLKDEVGRLDILFRSLKYSPLRVRVREAEVMVDAEKFKEGLKIFRDKGELPVSEIEEPVFWGGIQENILFYNPVEGTVRPQSRLLWRAIRELV